MSSMDAQSNESRLPERFNDLRGIDRLLAVVAELRHPDHGCPWDLKQTHRSLRPYVLEEAYETAEAIDTGQDAPLREELGDLLLQIALHAQLASEREAFDFDAVAAEIAEKLVRRHPHVFGEVAVDGAEEVTANWEAIKAEEKRRKGEAVDSILSGISGGLPALMRAHKASKRAVKHGFAWPDEDSLWACVMSEFDEFRAESTAEGLEEEMGDILFATVSLAGHYGVDPEVALHRATGKFFRRFQWMERHADKPLDELSFEEWDALWKRAKGETRSTP